MVSLESERLILRQWQDQDRAPFAMLNADADVMKFFLNAKTREQSNQSIDAFKASIDKQGWGFWAAELKHSGDFIGFIGLNDPATSFTFSPCVEVGWRLSKQYWRKGYASEGALLALKFAFEYLDLESVVSMTPVVNKASIGVMQKIGMSNSHKNFYHPSIPNNHYLSEHVLYTMTQDGWSAKQHVQELL